MISFKSITAVVGISRGTSVEILDTSRPESVIGSLGSTNAMRHIYHRAASVIQASIEYRARSTYKATADECPIDILVKGKSLEASGS